MSDDWISDGQFKGLSLTALIGGVALYGYNQFFRKRSYLVEWSATRNDDLSALDKEETPFEKHGTLALTDRFNTHEDLVAHVLAEIQARDAELGAIDPSHIVLQIGRIHIL